MVLLIDTNVLMDALLKREPFFEDAIKIFRFCRRRDNEGYVAFHTISNLWYLLRKFPDAKRREFVMTVCEAFTVTGASHEEVIHAVQNAQFRDLEDCLQDRCAVSVGADYIVTRNLSDFTNSEVPAISPKTLCASIGGGFGASPV